MEQLKRIVIFGEVVKNGSMSKAGECLGMTASAVSLHLQHLEAHYGLKLMNRNTRRFELTEAGEILWRQSQKLAALMQETDEQITALKNIPSGTVRISLPTGFIRTAAVRAFLAKMEQAFPSIRIALFTEDSLANLQENAADIAVRAGEANDSPDNVAYALGEWAMYLAASPEYLAENPIEKPADVLTAQWLNHSDTILFQCLNALNLPEVPPRRQIACRNAAVSAYYLAAENMGLTFILSGEFELFAQNRRLQKVLPDYPLPPKRIYAVVANAKQSAKNTAVLGMLKEAFKQYGKGGI